jgi:hypothetical protein
MTRMRTQQPSITQDLHQDQLPDSFNLDPTHSHTRVLSMLCVPSQGPYTRHGSQQRGQALNDSTRIRNTRPTTSSRPTIKPTMMRRSGPASPHSSLLQLQ